MPRVCTGVIADRRTSISFAALLVKVTARIASGEACPVASSHAIRVVSTRVLPLPAPARISADWCGSVTAASCSGLRLARSGEVICGRDNYTVSRGSYNSRTLRGRSAFHETDAAQPERRAARELRDDARVCPVD